MCHWQMRLKTVFDLAEVSNGQGNAISHRFRDTSRKNDRSPARPLSARPFCWAIKACASRQKHYTPWVRSRQEQPEADDPRAPGSEIRC